MLKKIQDSKFKLVISSPPYNIGKEYETKIGLDKYLEWQTDIIEEICRITLNNGSIVWQVGNYVNKSECYPLDIYFYPIFKKFGLKLKNRIIWHFGHGLHASKKFSGRYEVLLWFTKSDDYTFNLDSVRVPCKYPNKLHYKGEKKGKPSCNPLGKNPSDFWEMMKDEFDQGILNVPNVKSNHPEKTSHPCQFPVELAERCILAFSNEGDWILDPFGGSGSSLIAAIKNNRNGVMIDNNEEYIRIARKRLSLFNEGRLKTRALGKPVFDKSK